MLGKLIRQYHSKKDLLHYFILTYLDKIISFALPLSILFIIKDKALYNYVEAVFSYAVIILTVIELGFCNYLFYGYKQAAGKEDFIRNAEKFFKFILLVYLIAGALGGLVFRSFFPGSLALFFMIFARTLITFYINFYSGIFRLKDKPAGIYLVSISVNIASVVLLIIAHYFSREYELMLFFAPSLLFIGAVQVKYVLSGIGGTGFSEFLAFLKKALTYSWPIILNVLAMNFMNNYAKIYAFGNLSEQEMVQISYTLRIGLIIQLTHTSFLSFYSKMLFMDEQQQFNFRVFRQYNLIILLSVLLVLSVIGITNFLFQSTVHIPFSLETLLFIAYIILWCYIAYLELYFGVLNANKMILIYSLIASAVYVVLLKFSTDITLFKLSVFMFASAALNLLLAIWGLNRAGILKRKI